LTPTSRTTSEEFRIGNPHGNRHHTRHLLNQEFIQALLLHFREHGKKAIEKVAREQPASYLKTLAQDLDFWRDNDTVEVIGLPIEFERSTDVKSKVGG
jgi:hypothetical protein